MNEPSGLKFAMTFQPVGPAAVLPSGGQLRPLRSIVGKPSVTSTTYRWVTHPLVVGGLPAKTAAACSIIPAMGDWVADAFISGVPVELVSGARNGKKRPMACVTEAAVGVPPAEVIGTGSQEGGWGVKLILLG